MADEDAYVLVGEARAFCRGVTESLEAAHLTRCCALVQRLTDELERLRAEFDLFRQRALEEIAEARGEGGGAARDIERQVLANLQKAADAYSQMLAAVSTR
jgi:hypothetical protein